MRFDSNKVLFRRVTAGCLLVSGCTMGEGPTVGQSGSEGVPKPGPGPGAITCPCQSSAWATNVLRVTLREVRAGGVTFQVNETLNVVDPVATGEVIAAAWDGSLACFAGCAELHAGEEALAFYVPWKPGAQLCEDSEFCITECRAADKAEAAQCSGFDAADGTAEAADIACERRCEEIGSGCGASAAQSSQYGFVSLSPWGEAITFAEGRSGTIVVSGNDLSQLWNYDHADRKAVQRCVARFGDWSDL